MRVNLGSGKAYLDGWVNVDSRPDVPSDYCGDVFDFVLEHSASVEEIYMGHLLEHMLYADAVSLLTLLVDRLSPGTLVSAVTPDMRSVFEAYLAGQIDNHELNEFFVYSYAQPSHHRWCYDTDSLTRLFSIAGFADVSPVDVSRWEPVYHKAGPNARWQCGVHGIVPDENPRGVQRDLPAAAAVTANERLPAELAVSPAGSAAAADGHRELLDEIRRLRAQMARYKGIDPDSAQLLARQLADMRQRLEGVENSLSFRAAHAVSLALRRVLPAHTPQRRLAESLVRRIRPLRHRE